MCIYAQNVHVNQIPVSVDSGYKGYMKAYSLNIIIVLKISQTVHNWLTWKYKVYIIVIASDISSVGLMPYL